MYMYLLIGLLIIAIIYLIYKLNKKQQLDRTELEDYNTLFYKIEELQHQREDLRKDIKAQQNIINEYNEKIFSIQKQYREELNKKSSDLDTYFENQKNMRQADLDTEFDRQEKERKESLNLRMQQMTHQAQEQVNKAEAEARSQIEKWKKAQDDIAAVTNAQEERFEALLEPLRKYEMEQQERLFYTIQVPDEYKEDINFLITTVSQKVQHPDIINKLVWAEYVRPYIEQTFKRVGIEEKSGIYKITNIDSGKCYIGKSANIKKRIVDHFKSSIGIKTIADQAVHHEIWKTGFWNWTVEPIIYCSKEELSELEKYYIEFFKSNIFGYNKTGGGEG